MHFMKAIQVFATKRVERWRMGQEADSIAVKCPPFLDLDLSQQAFGRAQHFTIHACPPVLAIHT